VLNLVVHTITTKLYRINDARSEMPLAYADDNVSDVLLAYSVQAKNYCRWQCFWGAVSVFSPSEELLLMTVHLRCR